MEEVIVLIVKKGEEWRSRGVALMLFLYKIYVKVLAERLKEEIEMKRIISENQIEIMDNK